MTEEIEQSIDEELLFFRRFPAEKQDQVRALVNYATLMGLNGKDLVSIGGKLDRLKAAQEKKEREAILEEMLARCTYIGKDNKDKYAIKQPTRFNYTDGSGRKWKFDQVDYWGCRVTSDTGKTMRLRFQHYCDIKSSQRDMKQALLNIHYGHLVLNF